MGKGVSVQIFRPTLEPQHEDSCSSVTSQIVGKMPKFSTFNGNPIQKGEVSFKQQAFEAKNVIQIHTEATLREGMVWSLYGTTAYLVQYVLFEFNLLVWIQFAYSVKI